MTAARATAINLTTNVGTACLGLLTSMILARGLGPAGRGEMAAALAWPAMLTWAGAMGLGQATVFYAAQQPKRRPALFANAFWFSLGWGLVLAAAVFSLVPRFVHLHGMPLALLKGGLLALPISLLADSAAALALGAQQFRLIRTTRLVVPLVTATGLLACACAHALSAAGAILCSWAGSGCSMALLLTVLRREQTISLRPDLPLLAASLRYGAQAHVGTISNLANRRLDQLLLTGLVAPKQLGLYVFAVTLSEMLTQLSSAVALTIFPQAAKDGDNARRAENVLRGVRWSLLTGTAGAGLLWAAAPHVIWLLWGPRYLPCVTALDILLPGVVALGMADILSAGLRGSGHALASSWGEMVSLAVMVPLLLHWLPLYGIAGAALASTIGYAADALVLTVAFAHVFGAQSLRGVRPSRRDWDDACFAAKMLAGKIRRQEA